LYSERFLLRRPLLEALQADEPVVLLIDELDRADDEFEAFLLELLSDFQVSIPELGHDHAQRRPLVVITSNRTRELHDALKRAACTTGSTIPRPPRGRHRPRAAPGLPDEIAWRVCTAVARLRGEELYKLPGVGETIAWAQALLALDDAELESTLAWCSRSRRTSTRSVAAGCCTVPDDLGERLVSRVVLLAGSMRAAGRPRRRR
jgi:MoxR-like ATPase